MQLDLRVMARHTNVVGLAAILSLFGPGVYHFIIVSFSADRANDDSRQVTWPLLRYANTQLFTPDPIADYYLENQMPLGYHALVGGLAHVFDAVPLLTTVGLLSFAIAAFFAFLTGRVLAGLVGGWICVAFILAADALLYQTAGGLPRATGFALAFMALYGFLCDRRAYTGLASLLGALFWYPIAVSAGVLFALQCLAPQTFFGWKQSGSLIVRASMVSIVGCLAIGFSAPKVLFESRWGPVVSNVSPAWPEAGPLGRFYNWPENQLGLGRPIDTAGWALESGFINRAGPWFHYPGNLDAAKSLSAQLVSLGLLLGLVVMSKTDRTARRLLAVVALSICLYVAAIIFAPLLYAPSRFVMSVGPGTCVFAFVYLTYRMGASLSKRSPTALPGRVQLLTAALVILALGGRPFDQGYEEVHIDEPERQALDFISGLPTESLIAGWPKGILDDIPLFSRRRVLLSYETHLPFHEAYLRDMRARAEATIDSWFSSDTRPVRALLERYGVTHFVIEKHKAAKSDLWYFRPFDQHILKKRAELDGRKSWAETPPRKSVVFENGRVVIVDVKKLSPPSKSETEKLQTKSSAGDVRTAE